ADHGEALGDHGESTHGVFLYEATLHVPLLVRFPDRAGAGARVTARVRLADVAPTILDAVGVPVPSELQGASMRGVAVVGAGVGGGVGRAGRAGGDAAAGQRGRSDRTADAGGGDRPVYSETVYPRQAFGWSALASWRSDRFLLVKAPRRELYDLVAGPAASHDIAATRPRGADGPEAGLGAFLRAGGAGGGRRGGGGGR